MLGLSLTLLLVSFPVDKAAHLGVSYAATHVGYQLCKQIAGEDNKIPCLVGSAAAVLTAGAFKELDGNRDSKDMLANTIGVGAAGLTISFDF